MTVAFSSDTGDTQLTGAQSGMKEIVEKKRLEMSLESATDIEAMVPKGTQETPDASPSTEPEAPAAAEESPAAPVQPEAAAP